MEHLADIDKFMAECLRVLTPDGVMIIAVPPIATPHALKENIKNVFHVTNLTPFGWKTKIERHFKEVICHLHQSSGKWSDIAENMAEVFRPAAEVTIRETDFDFPEVPIDILNRESDNITAIFIARQPRADESTALA